MSGTDQIGAVCVPVGNPAVGRETVSKRLQQREQRRCQANVKVVNSQDCEVSVRSNDQCRDVAGGAGTMTTISRCPRNCDRVDREVCGKDDAVRLQEKSPLSTEANTRPSVRGCASCRSLGLTCSTDLSRVDSSQD